MQMQVEKNARWIICKATYTLVFILYMLKCNFNYSFYLQGRKMGNLAQKNKIALLFK